MTEEETQVGFKFAMPFEETMEIRSSKFTDDLEVGSDEEIEGIVYRIYWNDQPLPWCTKTKLQAIAIAFGCQWGAREMAKKLR